MAEALISPDTDPVKFAQLEEKFIKSCSASLAEDKESARKPALLDAALIDDVLSCPITKVECNALYFHILNVIDWPAPRMLKHCKLGSSFLCLQFDQHSETFTIGL